MGQTGQGRLMLWAAGGFVLWVPLSPSDFSPHPEAAWVQGNWATSRGNRIPQAAQAPLRPDHNSRPQCTCDTAHPSHVPGSCQPNNCSPLLKSALAVAQTELSPGLFPPLHVL